jgi:hypothetical protein
MKEVSAVLYVPKQQSKIQLQKFLFFVEITVVTKPGNRGFASNTCKSQAVAN